MKRIGIILLGVIILLLDTQALAITSRYLAGYGKYNLSSSGVNELAEIFNSWTQNTLGIIDFRMSRLDEAIRIYSIGSTWIPSPRWEVQLTTTALTPIPITLSDSKESTVSLGGGQKTLKAEGDIDCYMIPYDLMGYYLFSSSSKFTPFVAAGLTYADLGVGGHYSASEEVYTLPSGYEYRWLEQSFSFHGSRLAYVLGAGIDAALGKHFRLGLEVKHHWVPTIECEVVSQNEGFSSLPLGSELEMNSSGMSYGLYLMFHF